MSKTKLRITGYVILIVWVVILWSGIAPRRDSAAYYLASIHSGLLYLTYFKEAVFGIWQTVSLGSTAAVYAIMIYQHDELSEGQKFDRSVIFALIMAVFFCIMPLPRCVNVLRDYGYVRKGTYQSAITSVFQTQSKKRLRARNRYFYTDKYYVVQFRTGAGDWVELKVSDEEQLSQIQRAESGNQSLSLKYLPHTKVILEMQTEDGRGGMGG